MKKAFPTALRHAAACSLSNEDCGESIAHSFEVVISIHWTGLGFTFNPIKPVILHLLAVLECNAVMPWVPFSLGLGVR